METFQPTFPNGGDALSSIGVRVIENVNVADDSAVLCLAETPKGESVDIPLNDAGILRADSIDTVNFDDMLEQFRVNTIRPLRETHALRDNLKSGAKVGIVTSRVGSIDDNSSGNNYGYRCSKAGASPNVAKTTSLRDWMS